jgi:hypothetical protein
MADKNVNLKDSVGVIEEIESKMESIWIKRKEEIERELEARIRAEREEAERKIEAIEREISKGGNVLQDYRTVVSEFETERASLQTQIKAHFDKAVGYQTEIEKMAGLTMEELRLVRELNAKLDALHQSAEVKVNSFRKDLEEKFGIVAELPESLEEEELKVDLEQELTKLKKIKQILEAGAVEVGEPPAVEPPKPAKPPKPPTPTKPSMPAEPEAEPPVTNANGVPLNVPEVSQIIEESVAEEAGEKAIPEEPVEEKAAGQENGNFQSLFEILEGYRKIETRNGNGEISFFQKDKKTILDGEYMVASIDESLEEAKRLYMKLAQTESPKEQFFIKQEIINHQEILRKYILRNLKMCEKEGAALPSYTADILNQDILKEILEKLSMENWSNPSDFNSFRSQIEAFKDSYYAKITPPINYLRSLIKELGA